MKKADVIELYAFLSSELPEPRTELEYGNPYQLVVAVALSAQATDVGVNKATDKLFKKIKTPQQMLKLGLEGLREHIKTIGLYNSKAKNVIRMSELLIERHGGEVPNDQAALEALPGVGRKTANVVRNEIFREPTIAVDTHIFRVSNRTGLAPGKTPLAVEKKLLKVTPPEFALNAHHWLLLHGRYICKSRKPDCPACGIAHLCRFKGKTTA